MNKFQELRIEAAHIRTKLHEGKTVTSEELTTLLKVAQANPSTDNIGLYAIAKKRVDDSSKEEDKDDDKEVR